MKEKGYSGYNKETLLFMAKELNIIGRHSMRKQQLVEAIEALVLKKGDDNLKQKDEYIENARIGTIVAFKVNESKTISGKIEEIHKNDFVVETKNGVKFTVRKRNVIWVKTGDRWPKGVFEALKGGSSNETRPVDKVDICKAGTD